ncbi:MAG: hypothetical protein LIR50_10565 [Bacillota bacterium]|jgi:hypothetical protein|nr:hypothetical protein [Bacillota bacterium]
MNVNPIQLINMIKNGQNPQQLMMNILGQNNPILENAMNLAQNGNTSALEMIARNLAQQRGLDFDTEFAKFKNYLNQ